MSTEDVRVLVSHSILLTAERYYAPWDRSRRDRPTRTVRDAHQRDPLLAELCGDPAQEPGGSCNGSPVLPSGPGGRIRLGRASLSFQGIYGPSGIVRCQSALKTGRRRLLWPVVAAIVVLLGLTVALFGQLIRMRAAIGFIRFVVERGWDTRMSLATAQPPDRTSLLPLRWGLMQSNSPGKLNPPPSVR